MDKSHELGKIEGCRRVGLGSSRSSKDERVAVGKRTRGNGGWGEA